MKWSFISFIMVLFFLTGCSGGNDSILSTPVQKDPGSLAILNPSSFLGATVAGTAIDHVLYLKSNGGLSLSDISVSITTNDPIGFKDGVYPGTDGTCGTTLKSGETCTIVLRYEPQSTSSHLASLRFTYKDALKNYEFDYQVTADSNPILSFEYGTLYDFGNKFLGTSTDLRIRISNTGRVAAQSISINNLASPFSMKGGSYPGTGGTCGITLSPGETCDIYVNYSPTNNGEHLQNITLTYLNAQRLETNTLRLIAWGFLQAQLTISDSSGHNFGTVATKKTYDKTFTVTHSGGDVSATSLDVLNLAAPFKFKNGSFPGTGGNCKRTLTKEAGQCFIVVSIDTETSGSWNNTISFTYFNGTSTQSINRTLNAITRKRAEISISPAGGHSFGTVAINSSSARTFNLTYVQGEMPVTGITFSPLSGFFRYTGGTFPGTGGTCGASFSSGTCSISLSYAPTGYGVHPLSTIFKYNDGAEIKEVPMILEGTSESQISTTSNTSFGNVVNRETGRIVINLNATAGNGIKNLAMSSISGPFSFMGDSFPGTGGTCTATMNPSTTCSIVLNFKPTTVGNHSGTLILSYDGGVGNKTYNISLSGTSTPAAYITIPHTNFGSTSVNSVKQMTVTLTNESTISPTSSTWSFPAGFGFKGGSFPGTGGSCWSSTCSIVLIFSPTEAKTYSGVLSLTYNNGTGKIETASANITGDGFLTNDLFISNFDTVNFTSIYVGVTKSNTFNLSHGGGSTAANINTKGITNSTDYTIVSDNCPASLNNGATCTFTVRFEPKTSGTKNSSLNVTYNNGTDQTVSRLVTGSGVNPALLTPTPSALSFGNRSTDGSYDLSLTITHSGTPDATTFTRSVSGTGFEKVSDNCPVKLSTGGSCSITVRFTPTTAMNFSGNLTLSYGNGFKTETLLVPLTGTGLPTAILKFASDPFNFGQIIQTQSVTKTITLNHSGPIGATGMSSSALNPPYSFTGGTYPGTGGTCSDTLSSGPCTMVIDFAPTTTGVKNQILNLSYFNGNNSKVASTRLTGESLSQAIISISEANPYNFGVTNINSNIDKTFTMTNGGDVSATSLGGNFDQNVFSFKDGTFPGSGGNCGTTLASGASCNIVLSFRPAAAINYNGTFTLNYNDGLREQLEYKNLSGLGRAAIQFEKYEDLLSDQPVLKFQKIFAKDSSLWGEISFKSLRLYRRDGTLLFQEKNHLFPFVEGINVIKLNEDFNRDGANDLLFSIHERDSTLKGHSIRCGRTGKVLVRYQYPPSL